MTRRNTTEDHLLELWSLIRKNNILFSQKTNLKKFKVSLRLISEEETVDVLVGLMTLYLYANNLQKTLIEEHGLPILRRIGCDTVATLDERLRSSISYTRWSSKVTSHDAQQPGLFQWCVLACHPNGYTRERALVALAKYPEPITLALAIRRCNDWVSPIRIVARDTSAHLISNLSTSELLETWNVFAQVSEGQRHRDILFKETVFPLLRKRVSSKILHRQLLSENSQTRRYAAEIMWETHQTLSYSDLLALCNCSDPYICFRTLRDILPRIDLSVRTELLNLIQRKKWAPARLERLRIMMTDHPESTQNELKKALCDRSGTIRNFARFHLKNNTGINVEALYISKLNSNKTIERINALYGIQEIGSPPISDLADKWLRDSNPRIVAAALHVSPKELISKRVDYILNLITSDTPHVSKAAYAALCKEPPTADKILIQFKKDTLTERQTMYFANLLLLQRKWESAAHAIKFYRHHSSEVQKCGLMWLHRWIYGQRTSWLTPSKSDLEKINRELDKSSPLMTEQLSEEILFLMNSYR